MEIKGKVHCFFEQSKEEWKDIKGFEGLYQVSNLGRVRSLDHYRKSGKGGYITKGRVLKQNFDGKKRYLHVALSKGKKTRTVQVHTLVGKHFIIGYKEGLEIDHIDTNPINNKSNNLRWVDRSANMLNPKTHAKIIKHHIEVQRRPVIGINIKNGFILEFDYVRQAKAAGFKGIGENLHGRAKQCKGYIWRYADEVQF